MIESKNESIINIVSENVLNLKYEDLDQPTIDLAKSRIIDVIGCAIGGANAPGNKSLINLIKRWGGHPEASIPVYGIKAPAHYAAMANCIMCRSYDYEAMMTRIDDKLIPSHISGTTVMTALTMAEFRQTSGKQMLVALLAGDDLAARILNASDFDFSLGWDSIGSLNAFGATAIAGRILNLTPDQLRNAFGIVVNMTAGTLQSIWDGATTFKFYQGTAAHNGIIAAELAQEGWTGLSDPLLSRFGYYKLYTGGCRDESALTQDLGKKIYQEGVFKPYPCCRATHAAIDCAIAIQKEHQVDAADVEKVILKVPQRILNSFIGKEFIIREYPHADAIFSLKYTVAIAILKNGVRLEHFSEKTIKEPAVAAFIKRIQLEDLKAESGAALTLQLKDGTSLSTNIETAKGDPLANPMVKEDITAKFLAQVAFSGAINETDAKQIISQVETLEQMDNIQSLVRW